ncbi:MAG: EH signature domain-containing protein [Candidatus Poribacteria bacterium]|nr:EH signature domain-containing protein [Candidatus Poribacteria bacterium]MDE0504179.1 EH signature domain-containing protein [Candidatus Poribacteria bacterium]
MASAKKLLQFDFDADAFARRAPQPTAIPKELVSDLEGIERKHNSMCNIPEREDLREIYHLFFNAIRTGRLHTEFDSPKRIRRLAWALTYAEPNLPCIVDTPELRDALQIIDDRFRISVLLGVFDALMEAWDAWGANLLRTFVRRHLSNYDGRRRFVQNLRANMAWYCEEDGATLLATRLLRDHVKLSDVWSHLKLPNQMRPYCYFGIVGVAYVRKLYESNHRLDQETIVDIIEFVKRHGNNNASRAILSGTIEKLGIDASDDLREPVKSYVLEKWKDPRITGNVANWGGVSNEAQQIFTRWITVEDIRFFFDAVANACNDPKFEYRKAFWLEYLERISSCRPVLGRNVHRLLRNNPQALEYYRERQPATLTGGNSDQHAFIIQMGDYTFVEISTEGACYVYDNSSCPFELEDSQYHMSELRNRTQCVYRQPHIGSERYHWQSKFAQWISHPRAIETRSYRLDSATDRETNRISNLIQGLCNKRTWQAYSQELVGIGRPAVPELIRALSDVRHKVRFRAINTLGEMGGVAEEAMPKLRQLRQSDEKDYVRIRAGLVLERINRLS